jgi:Ca2+-binding EF-hand superfamily protein
MPLFLVVTVTLAAWYGSFLCDSGRDFMWKLAATKRSFLIEVPLHERGTTDFVLDRIYLIAMELPLFILGYESDRIALFRGMRQSGGRITPFAGGVALHDYEDVKEILEDPQQTRQASVIGSRKINEGCMAPDNLIFTSTGPKHRELTEFLTAVVPAMSQDYVASATPLLSSKHTMQSSLEGQWYDIFAVDGRSQLEASIRGDLVANVWYEVFGEELSPSQADIVQHYGTWGDLCFHFSNAGYTQPGTKLHEARLALLAAAAKSPTGTNILKQASHLGKSTEEASSIVLQLVDWVLHSGALDQTSFIRRTLERIENNPSFYVPLWNENPTAFIAEMIRKEPPTTSVTTTLTKPQNFSVAAGFRGAGFVQVTLEAGTPILSVISSANQDPRVFGGDTKSAAVAKMFNPTRNQSQRDQILTPKGAWIKQQQAQLPRAAFGEALQLSLTLRVVNKYLPAPTAPAKAISKSSMTSLIQWVKSKSLDTLSAMSDSPLNKEVPLGLTVICCIYQLLKLKWLDNHPGVVSVIKDKYALFLIALMSMAFGKYLGGCMGVFICNHAGIRMASAYAEMTLYMQRHLGSGGQHFVYGISKWNPIRLYDVPAGTAKVLTFEIYFHFIFGLVEIFIGEQFPFYTVLLVLLLWSTGCGVLNCFFALASNEKEHDPSWIKQNLQWGVAGMFAHIFFAVAPAYILGGQFYSLISHSGECLVSIRWAVLGCKAADARIAYGDHRFGQNSNTTLSDENMQKLHQELTKKANELLKNPKITDKLDFSKKSESKDKQEFKRAIAHECFKHLGGDASGEKISRDGLERALEELKLDVNDKEVDAYFNEMDKDKNGTIEFSEFEEHRFGNVFCTEISDTLWLEQYSSSKMNHRMKTSVLVGIVAIAILYFLPGIRMAISGGELCFFEVDKLATPQDCTAGANILDKTCRHTRSMYRVLKVLATPRAGDEGLIPGNTLHEGLAETAKGTAVKIPTSIGKHKRKNLPYCKPTFDNTYPDSCQIPDGGEDTDKQGDILSSALFSVLATSSMFPLADMEDDWDNAQEASAILKAASRTELKPLELYPWPEMESDLAITRFSFAGIAAHNTERVEDGGEIVYRNAWDWLYSYELRPGFEPYGVNAYFNSNGELIQMYWAEQRRNLTRGDPDWEHVKWAYKVSVLTGVTVRDHLVGVHFMRSNMLTMASDENLMPDHPLRRLLRPHTFGAIEINLGAMKTLGLELGTAHRASALSWKGLADALSASYQLNRFHKVMDILPNMGMDKTVAEDANRTLEEELFPYGKDHEEFWKIVHKFVNAYVNVYYTSNDAVLKDTQLGPFWDALHVQEPSKPFPELTGKDELVDVLTTFIVFVTGIHNQVGNVADYLIDPTYASAKIRPGMNSADIQATFQGLNIGLMTSQLTPRLLNDWKHLLLHDEHHATTSQIFDTLQSDLRQFSQTLDARNEKRRFPCNAFNPKTMVAAVSI